jgi:CBS domain-containing protein
MSQRMSSDTLRVRDVMQRNVVTIDARATVQDLVELLSYHGIGGVPVMDAIGRVVGVVSTTDVVRLAAEQADVPMWYVEETGEPKPSEYYAGGRPAPRELRAIVENNLSGFRVEEIMTPATFSVREEATLAQLASFLLNAGIHRALVMDGGELRGIVTATEVLRAVATDIEPIRAPAADSIRPGGFR